MTACSGTRCSTTPESVSACSRPNIRAMPCRTRRPAHDPVTDRQPVFRPFRKPGPPAAHEDAAVLYYTVTTIGGNGRLVDSSPLKRPGWELNQAVAIEVVDEVILVTTSSAGPFSVTSQHHLHLPAEIRRFYRIQAGDRLTGCRRTRTTTPGALSTHQHASHGAAPTPAPMDSPQSLADPGPLVLRVRRSRSVVPNERVGTLIGMSMHDSAGPRQVPKSRVVAGNMHAMCLVRWER